MTVRIDGSKLRMMLEEAGITQRDLAAKVGVNHYNVNRWCKRGQSASIKYGNIEKMAEALGMTVDGIIDRCGADVRTVISSGTTLSPAETTLVALYRSRPPIKQAKLLLEFEKIVKEDC